MPTLRSGTRFSKRVSIIPESEFDNERRPISVRNVETLEHLKHWWSLSPELIDEWIVELGKESLATTRQYNRLLDAHNALEKEHSELKRHSPPALKPAPSRLQRHASGRPKEGGTESFLVDAEFGMDFLDFWNLCIIGRIRISLKKHNHWMCQMEE